MPATRDGKGWRCQFYYKDWQGIRHKKNKSGVVGKKETIVPMLEEMQNMQIILKEVAEDFKNREVTLSEAGLEEMRCDFESLVRVLIDLLDGAEYLWRGTEYERKG